MFIFTLCISSPSTVVLFTVRLLRDRCIKYHFQKKIFIDTMCTCLPGMCGTIVLSPKMLTPIAATSSTVHYPGVSYEGTISNLLSGGHQCIEFLFQALLLHENAFQYVLQEEEEGRKSVN